jgi:hypothetical protein
MTSIADEISMSLEVLPGAVLMIQVVFLNVYPLSGDMRLPMPKCKLSPTSTRCGLPREP